MFKKVVLAGLLSSLSFGFTVTDCHAHGSDYYCVTGDVEGQMVPSPTGATKPISYTGCHGAGSVTYCSLAGRRVEFVVEATADDHSGESSPPITTSAAAQTTAITGCHFHDATQFCLDGEGREGYVSPAPTNTASAPSSYTGCHAHATDVFCMAGDSEVHFVVEEEEDSHNHGDETHSITGAAAATGQTTAITGCHFHGATQYCLDGEGKEGFISPAPTNTASAPSSYTSCHAHATDKFCMAGGSEVQFVVEKEDHNQGGESHSITTNSASAQTTAITSCHFHEATQFCVDGFGREGYVSPAPTNTASAPSSYTGCHSHEADMFCMAGGLEVQFVVEGSEVESSSESSGANCHFHAGVEHCVGGSHEVTCERVDRDYNIPLRIGTLFAILAASTIGVFLPMLFNKFNTTAVDWIVGFLTQFGTGVIISTALVHLITHSMLMFGNECLELQYESTSTAIVMAGLFVGFLADFLTTRILMARSKVVEGESDGISDDNEKGNSKSVSHVHVHGFETGDKISVLMLEAGIIFHSILIGVTTVVAGDSSYITLFIVILFHQAFEGVALGSRIAALKDSIWVKILMGMGFAVTTPVGMGIGIGVLQHFNGNDPSTVIAIGTLDAFSAGILLWVGLIEMLAHDWLYGPLAKAGLLRIAMSLVGLIAGMVLMSFLGKWA